MLGFVQLGEEFVERNADGGVWDGEFAALRLDEAGGGGEVGAAAGWVDGPDVLDPHRRVVVDAFLQLAERIAWGEDLDAEQGWMRDDVFKGDNAAQDTEIRDAVAVGAYLDPLFRLDPNLPLAAMYAEDTDEVGLHTTMGTFSQKSSPDLAFEVIAVGAVGGREILRQGDERGGGCEHPETLLGIILCRVEGRAG